MNTAAWPHTRTPHWVAVVLALTAHIAVLYAWLDTPRRTITPSEPSSAMPIDVRIITPQATPPTPAPPTKPVQAQPPKPMAQPKQTPRTPPSQTVAKPQTPPSVEPNVPAVAPALPAPTQAVATPAPEPTSTPNEPQPVTNTIATPATPSADSAWIICPGYQHAIRASPPPRQVVLARMGGEVLVEFTVQPDGSIQNPRVITTTNHQLNRWALRTVEHSMRCIGQNQPMQLRLPIKLTFDTP